MSDPFFDADRASGTYPPKGWGWKDREQQRKALASHFWRINSQIDPWMVGEAARLEIPLPTRSLSDADVYMPIVYGTQLLADKAAKASVIKELEDDAP